MSHSKLAVQFTENFFDSVHLLDRYFQERNPVRGKRFVQELFSLLYDVVVPFPQSQPLFQLLYRQLPGREFRKAIFRRQCLPFTKCCPTTYGSSYFVTAA